MDPKYHVLKRTDWEKLRTQLAADGGLIENHFLDGDVFVVREQDVFAPAGLYAYAANIHSAVEFTDTLGLSVMDEDTRERLMSLADDLVGMADKWKASNTSKKVPD